MYGLTPVGGALWEIERTPIWRSYAAMLWDCPETLDELTLLSVVSPSKTTGRHSLESLCRRFGGRVDWTTLEAQRRRGDCRVPWKRFPYFVEWRIQAVQADHFAESIPADFHERWEHENARRTWWTDPEDLQRFLSNG